MPEQISKYPEVTIQVLKGAGARCGEGAEQKILTQCPRERFCALSTGEVCIYGIAEIPQMTQITAKELAGIVCPPGLQSSMASISLSGPEIMLLGVAFAVSRGGSVLAHDQFVEEPGFDVTGGDLRGGSVCGPKPRFGQAPGRPQSQLGGDGFRPRRFTAASHPFAS